MTFHFVHLLKNCNKNLYNEWLKGDEDGEILLTNIAIFTDEVTI